MSECRGWYRENTAASREGGGCAAAKESWSRRLACMSIQKRSMKREARKRRARGSWGREEAGVGVASCSGVGSSIPACTYIEHDVCGRRVSVCLEALGARQSRVDA